METVGWEVFERNYTGGDCTVLTTIGYKHTNSYSKIRHACFVWLNHALPRVTINVRTVIGSSSNVAFTDGQLPVTSNGAVRGGLGVVVAGSHLLLSAL